MQITLHDILHDQKNATCILVLPASGLYCPGPHWAAVELVQLYPPGQLMQSDAPPVEYVPEKEITIQK